MNIKKNIILLLVICLICINSFLPGYVKAEAITLTLIGASKIIALVLASYGIYDIATKNISIEDLTSQYIDYVKTAGYALDGYTYLAEQIYIDANNNLMLKTESISNSFSKFLDNVFGSGVAVDDYEFNSISPGTNLIGTYSMRYSGRPKEKFISDFWYQSRSSVYVVRNESVYDTKRIGEYYCKFVGGTIYVESAKRHNGEIVHMQVTGPTLHYLNVNESIKFSIYTDSLNIYLVSQIYNHANGKLKEQTTTWSKSEFFMTGEIYDETFVPMNVGNLPSLKSKVGIPSTIKLKNDVIGKSATSATVIDGLNNADSDYIPFVASKINSRSDINTTVSISEGIITDVSTNVGTDISSDVIAQTGLLSSILSTLTSILDFLKNLFTIPDGLSLNFDPLKLNDLGGVFPFCIPFDFVKTFKLLQTSTTDPNFNINFQTSYFSVNHTIDISNFNVYVMFLRYTFIIWFAIFLIMKTRDLIKW